MDTITNMIILLAEKKKDLLNNIKEDNLIRKYKKRKMKK